MRKLEFLALAGLLCVTLGVSAQKDYASFVDPLIGSGGHGHVFVGASVPFSAVQLGPSNIYQGWDWCSGYHYSDNLIIGFSHNHLSGTGCSDLGDVSLMPYTGQLRTFTGTKENHAGMASSTFSHDNEKVAPGYYSVKLDNGVNVELTATERVGMHHYSFGEGTPRVLIDLLNGVGNRTYEAYVRKIDDQTVEGYRFVKGWAPQHKIFFYAKFSRPIQALNVFNNDKPVGVDELEGRDVKAVATFADDAKDLIVKVAISSVSCTNAKLNLEKELPGWDFDATHRAATAKWNKALSVIDIEGTPRQKKIFYTALYHTMIAPNLYCDVNGDFRGMDDRIYTGNKFQNYTTFSLWDTYRTCCPLYTLIATDRVDDMINSMLSIYDQNGKLPIWPLLAGETNCMPGYSSVPVIADAYLKGFKGFDAERALKYMVSTATNKQQNGVPEFMQYGYIPANKKGEATSINLEYAADDWGLALMAKKMGKTDIYNTFIKRGRSYELLFDKKINKIHPKMADGSWYEPYDPFLANHRNNVGDFTEGNGWQYTFMVPQCPDGLIALHGGDGPFIKNLDELFVAQGDLGEGAPPDVSGLIGQYAHGNEPNHHIPYMYVYAGAQYKTAARVRDIQERFYTDSVDGYCGNEDCGQMSAWHVMSALGIYQVNPSNGIFVFGSPLFKRATINLQNGKKFVISAPGNSAKNVYVKSVKLNGKPYKKSFITYQDIMDGGQLTFQMSSKPNKNFGHSQKDRPVSAK
jgi:predicted alpha-1,2-mannosidase